MEKSTYNSSIEDNQSYDIYEAHNPNPSAFAYSPTIEYHKSPARYGTNPPSSDSYNLAFKNEGFRDNSTFASANNSNYPSRADSVQENSITDETPIMNPENGKPSVSYPPYDYYNSDTLPLGAKVDPTGKSNSTLDSNGYKEYGGAYAGNKPDMNFLKELKNKMPQNNGHVVGKELPAPPAPPRPKEGATYAEKLQNLNFSPPDYNTVGLEGPPAYYVQDRPTSANILETSFDDPEPPKPRPKTVRSKSEAVLETSFDYIEPEDNEPFVNQPITQSSRSRSQPLETAM